MKLAILNDTHCGIRNSSDIFMKYQESFYTDIFFPYLLENNITQILHLGDYYDNRKTVNFKALHHNRKIFLEKLREYGITMDIILGNHDCYFKNTNDLNSLKELLGHYMNEVNIIEEPRIMDYDGCKIGLVPWINPENEEEYLKFIKNCKTEIIGAHLELTGFEMDRGLECRDGMSPTHFDKFEMVLTGHFHAKSTRGNIYYLGSQMEFYWNDCHDKKYFHIFDTDTRELTPILNPLTIHQKIYYDCDKIDVLQDLSYIDNKFVKLIVVNKGDPLIFERFVDRVQMRSIHQLKIVENFREFLGDSVNGDMKIDDTTELVHKYIDMVDTDLDKNRIKSEISELMLEAQNLEIA